MAILFLVPVLAQSQPERVLERISPRIRPGDLKFQKLEMTPDPVRENQRVNFQAVISNLSQHPGRVSLLIKDRDEVITVAHDVFLQPGNNRIEFPETYYRFSRQEHCFTLEVDIERSRRPVDLVTEVCARKTFRGWTLGRIGPFFVEDLDMFPDPVKRGQEVRFRARIRNEGIPVRADIQIQDRDQVVTHLEDAHLPSGSTEHYFPFTQYSFQRSDHCFTVIVDIEKTPHRVEAAREFCARQVGWTLKP
jgi:hypothetical protein